MKLGAYCDLKRWWLETSYTAMDGRCQCGRKVQVIRVSTDEPLMVRVNIHRKPVQS